MNLVDYDIILGFDFLKKAKISLMSYLNGIMITSEDCLYFISCYNVSITNNTKDENIFVLVIAIKKAL